MTSVLQTICNEPRKGAKPESNHNSKKERSCDQVVVYSQMLQGCHSTK